MSRNLSNRNSVACWNYAKAGHIKSEYFKRKGNKPKSPAGEDKHKDNEEMVASTEGGKRPMEMALTASQKMVINSGISGRKMEHVSVSTPKAMRPYTASGMARRMKINGKIRESVKELFSG